MINLKKAAQNITSKFGLLNSHRPLVLTISEERLVHDTLLKLILGRVNAATSFLRWAKNEENDGLKEAVCRLYDISLMFAQVQKECAESTNAFTVTLKEILQIEAGLETLRKQLKEITEKRERFQKVSQKDGLQKKSDNTSLKCSSEEIEQLMEQEELLRSELDVKTIKAEVFKTTNIKKSLNAVCDANLKLARKMESIFIASKQVLHGIPDLPNHLRDKDNLQADNGKNIVTDLAKELNIDRTLNSFCNASKSQFHVDLTASSPTSPKLKSPKSPKSPGRDLGFKSHDVTGNVKGKVGLNRPLPQPPNESKEKHWGVELKDFVIVSNVPPPKQKPPPIPRHNARKRSKSSGEKRKPKKVANERPHSDAILTSTNVNSEEDEEENSAREDNDDYDYVEPDDDSPLSNRIYRSSSDSELQTLSSQGSSYCEPFGHYVSWDNTTEPYARSRAQTEVSSTYMTRSGVHYERPYADEYYSQPYESSSVENRAQQADAKKKRCAEDDGEYSVPYDDSWFVGKKQESSHLGEDVGDHEYRELEKENVYQNQGEVYGGDNSKEHFERTSILSKPDQSNHHIVLNSPQQSPLPKPRHRTIHASDESTRLSNVSEHSVLQTSYSTDVGGLPKRSYRPSQSRDQNPSFTICKVPRREKRRGRK